MHAIGVLEGVTLLEFEKNRRSKPRSRRCRLPKKQ
jgi:hypothetical protein